MGMNVLEDEHATVETLGAVIRHAYFIHTFLITLTSTFLLLIMSFGNYWPSICQQPDAALFGLIGGIYVLSISGFALLLSIIFIDDCSWFYKFFILLCASFLFVSCGMYHLHGYFYSTSCVSPALQKFSISNNTLFSPATKTPLILSVIYRIDSEILYNCYQDDTVQEYSAYTPILIFACILAGVVYFLFAVYLILTLDMN